ncbi:MAG TPA: glucosamine-6-phosphate isomerase [Candidatus Scybalocola faecipullorum]|nr:glucosamine-6-phosphate isomerase [Candidatus Scybalocola faecipullorum]
MKYEQITQEQLGKGSPIQLEIVDTEEDLYYHMAMDMFDRITANNINGKRSVFIVPVGPIGQYRKLAKMCNQKNVPLQNVWLINMDEYLDEHDRPIPKTHPLSFRGFMEREFYNQVRPDLNVPVSQRIFPEPGREAEIGKLIANLGGVEVAYGGIGINGHIAFNEPPEDDTDDRTFKRLPTRVLSLTRETRTINSVTAANGYIDYIPTRCITVGMKEILSARHIRFYMNRSWQKGIVRKILHGPVTCKVPASFFQEHRDAKLIITKEVSMPPVGRLR